MGEAYNLMSRVGPFLPCLLHLMDGNATAWAVKYWRVNIHISWWSGGENWILETLFAELEALPSIGARPSLNGTMHLLMTY